MSGSLVWWPSAFNLISRFVVRIHQIPENEKEGILVELRFIYMLCKARGWGGGTVCSLDHLKLNIKMCLFCTRKYNLIIKPSQYMMYIHKCSMVLLNAIRREHKQLLGKIKLVFIWLEMPTHTHSNWKRHNKHPARVPYCSFFGIRHLKMYVSKGGFVCLWWAPPRNDEKTL